MDELGDITVKFPGKISLVYNPSCVVKDDNQSPFLMEEQESSSPESEISPVEVVITANHSDDQDSRSGDKEEVVEREISPLSTADHSEGKKNINIHIYYQLLYIL